MQLARLRATLESAGVAEESLLEWMDRTDDPLHRRTSRHLRDDAPDADD